MTARKNPKAVPFRFKDRYDVESQLCGAFAELGQLAGIKLGTSEHQEGIEPEVVEAVEQAYHRDPHFLGGPGIFVYVQNLTEAERVFANANRIADKLKSVIETTGGTASLKSAEPSLAVIEAAHAWAVKKYSR